MALHLVHININGLKANKNQLIDYLQNTETPVDIILINEIKVKRDNVPNIPGYRIVDLNTREDGRRSGGTAIFLNNNMGFTNIVTTAPDMAAVEITDNKGPIAIISWYIPPFETERLQLDKIQQIILNYPRTILAGDFNAKHIFFGSTQINNMGEKLFDIIEQLDLINLNNPEEHTYMSHIHHTTDTIDLIFCTKQVVTEITRCYTGKDIGSDHLPVHLITNIHQPKDNKRKRIIQCTSKCNWKLFSTLVSNGLPNLSPEDLNTTDKIEGHIQYITNLIYNSFDQACPKIKAQEGRKRISKETLELIRKKRKLRKMVQKFRDPVLRNNLNKLSRLISDKIKKESLNAWQEATKKLNHLKGKTLWRHFHNLTGSGKSSIRAVPPVRDNENDKSASNHLEAANIFAAALAKSHRTQEGNIFDQKFRQEVESYIQQNEILFKPSKEKPLQATNTQSHLAKPIETAELLLSLSKCKSNSAPGEDKITYTILKHLPINSIRNLAILFTNCLDYGYFPKAWKKAEGIMIPKQNKDPKDSGNYRPISLLPTIGKLLERIIANRIYDALEKANFFNTWQRAYRRKCEASEHLLRIHTTAKTMLKHRGATSVLSLDVEKAFDSVWHNGLKYKLAQLNLLPTIIIRFLSSFLDGRTITVKSGDYHSQPIPLQAGTPQGSVLSPLLFLIYVNDIPVNPENKCDAGQFADDISLWSSATGKNCKNLTKSRLQKAIKDIEYWCSKWRIKLNPAKTQLITFCLRKKLIKNTTTLTLFNHPIKEQNEITILGVTMNKSLSYISHCTKIAKKAMMKLHLLRKLRGTNWGANKTMLIKFYKQYVRPVLEYGSVCLIDSSKTAIKKLQTMQNNALRIAIRPPPRTSNKHLHKLAKIPLLKDRITILKDKTMIRNQKSKLMQDLNIFTQVWAKQKTVAQ